MGAPATLSGTATGAGWEWQEALELAELGLLIEVESSAVIMPKPLAVSWGLKGNKEESDAFRILDGTQQNELTFHRGR